MVCSRFQSVIQKYRRITTIISYSTAAYTPSSSGVSRSAVRAATASRQSGTWEKACAKRFRSGSLFRYYVQVGDLVNFLLQIVCSIEMLI